MDTGRRFSMNFSVRVRVTLPVRAIWVSNCSDSNYLRQRSYAVLFIGYATMSHQCCGVGLFVLIAI